MGVLGRARRCRETMTKEIHTINNDDTIINMDTIKIVIKPDKTHKTITNNTKNKGTICVRPTAIIGKITYDDNKVCLIIITS